MSTYLSQAFESGLYLKEGPPAANGSASQNPPNPLDANSMDGLMGGLKSQAVMMVPQMVLMGWINFFFQGFVLSAYFAYVRFTFTENYIIFLFMALVKLPFPLTLGFKSMLQRGIETQDMDVRWVSSLSWYFLNFFGLNGLYRLLLGNDNCQYFINYQSSTL